MSKKTRIIILSILAVLIVVVLSIGITTAFMKPVEQGGNLTEISLSSCAKIKLTGTSSVNLSNSYPMSRNRGFQTTPYSFTVTSYCQTSIGFNLYIATLNTNTIEASNIRYILTSKGSKDVVSEGLLSEATNGVSDFDDASKTELNTGLKGTYGNIYNIYNDDIFLKSNKEYDLYLFVDESATNTIMGKTFSAGVAVKAYDRESTLAEWVIKQYNDVQGNNNIYHHDGTLENGIDDGSYRYAGASDTTNNFVCFGSDETTCPEDNLYRIIGVFEDKVKLIKYDYATSASLGIDGSFYNSYTLTSEDKEDYKGSLSAIDIYSWATSEDEDDDIPSNEWEKSILNKVHLNTNFINNLGTIWANMIEDTTWKVSGSAYFEINPSDMYTAEIVNATKTYGPTNGTSKVGLMYASDYGFAASPSAWTTILYNYHKTKNTNWMYMGYDDWTLTTRKDDNRDTHIITSGGNIFLSYVADTAAIRPVMYLKSSITYASGSGTISDPIRIN